MECKRLLVTGGCGYIGSVLVRKLLAFGHKVRVIDSQWFGNYLEPHHNLLVEKGDIRNITFFNSPIDAVIHLAAVANDPCGELDTALTWEVNVYGTLAVAEAACRSNTKQFICASSASVYGLKDNRPVIETDSLTPVSDYNKTKQVAERVLLSYADKMAVQIIRPATVCGYSPRMRLDTLVNMLSMQALTKGEIVAHCGELGMGLMRPNIHIDDVTDLYMFMLEHPELTGIYNAGFENLSVVDTAEMIAKEIPSKVTISPVKDKRSYAVDSSKLLAAGFRPKRKVLDAILRIAAAYRTGALEDADRCYNLKWMRQHGLAATPNLWGWSP